MARVVKNALVRRRELLDTALSLFTTLGYERTSIEQITGAVGVSKGTFYHYFDSKQELLEALMTDWADTLFERISTEMEAMPADALTDLRLVFRRGSEMKTEQLDVTLAFGRSLYDEDNLRLRYHLMANWMDRIAALLRGIVEQGAAEGTFRVTWPAGAADAIAALWYGWAERHAAEMLDLSEHPERVLSLGREMTSLEEAMERILGMGAGELGLGLRESLDALAAAATNGDTDR